MMKELGDMIGHLDLNPSPLDTKQYKANVLSCFPEYMPARLNKNQCKLRCVSVVIVILSFTHIIYDSLPRDSINHL